jgi:Rho-binding antiterminator
MHPYIPINCEFHDRLEDLATVRKVASIHYRDNDGAAKQRDAVIKDVFARGGEEYVVLSTGEQVRLDHLIEIDGVRLDAFSAR